MTMSAVMVSFAMFVVVCVGGSNVQILTPLSYKRMTGTAVVKLMGSFLG